MGHTHSARGRAHGVADVTSFYPTFLYESLWDALMCLLASPGIARRFCERVKGGDVFLLYVCL